MIPPSADAEQRYWEEQQREELRKEIEKDSANSQPESP